MGRPFTCAGLPSFPYLQVDCLHFREREELSHMREIHRTLQEDHDVTSHLTKHCFKGDDNETLSHDLEWRHKEHGKTSNYWEHVISDFPLELSEGYNIGEEGPRRDLGMTQRPMDSDPHITSTRQFDGAHLVVAPFRCFHRADG